MEQVNMNLTKDNERIYRVINDLISRNKEFQIMITVPSTVQILVRVARLHSSYP